jgi:hypothetical protein
VFNSTVPNYTRGPFNHRVASANVKFFACIGATATPSLRINLRVLGFTSYALVFGASVLRCFSRWASPLNSM